MEVNIISLYSCVEQHEMLVAASCRRLENDHFLLFKVARMCQAIVLWRLGTNTSGKVHAAIAACNICHNDSELDPASV